METSTSYQAKIYLPRDPRPGILNNPYCATVKEFMLAMIAADYTYSHEEEICDKAIADLLIEKVGEKL